MLFLSPSTEALDWIWVYFTPLSFIGPFFVIEDAFLIKTIIFLVCLWSIDYGFERMHKVHPAVRICFNIILLSTVVRIINQFGPVA